VANARSPHKAMTRAEENGDDLSTQDAQLDDTLKSTTIEVPAGEVQGRQVSVWDLLSSDYMPEEKRQELLELYHERLYQVGELTLEQVKTVVRTIVTKAEAARAEQSSKVSGPGAALTAAEAEHTHRQDRT
ncbi:PLEC protein, partial [Nyctibius bracteatus]|nr:PLEC protein [Nyctibius bracteatus]